MIAHKDFESDCKRIAKYIMQRTAFSKDVVVVVSKTLLADFAKDCRLNKANNYLEEINKHLKGCSAKYLKHGVGAGWFITFEIEFD